MPVHIEPLDGMLWEHVINNNETNYILGWGTAPVLQGRDRQTVTLPITCNIFGVVVSPNYPGVYCFIAHVNAINETTLDIHSLGTDANGLCRSEFGGCKKFYMFIGY